MFIEVCTSLGEARTLWPMVLSLFLEELLLYNRAQYPIYFVTKSVLR
jgi:hypothetical protein